MLEQQVSARVVFTYGLWFASLAMWAGAWVLEWQPLGRLSLIVCGAAVTSSVKCMLIEQSQRLKNVLAVTSEVRSLRR